MSRFEDKLVQYVKGGGQAFFVDTVETARCLRSLESVAQRLSKKDPMRVVTWDCVSGFSLDGGEKYVPLQKALAAVIDSNVMGTTDALVVFKNAHPWLSKVPEIRQVFKNSREINAFNSAQGYRRPVVFVSNSYEIHPELQHDLVKLSFEFPTVEELEPVIAQVEEVVVSKLGNSAACPVELKDKLLRGLLGLTEVEAENILYYCVHQARGFTESALEFLEEEKAGSINSNGILEYVPRRKIESIDNFKGFERYTAWLRSRKKTYTAEAKAYNLDYPRGAALIGPPGTGKSAIAKATAQMMELPLVVLDYSAVFNSLVGESEGALRNALKQVRGLKGCVMLIDEADKALQGQSDLSGVSQRLSGILLSWLTDRPPDDRTFVLFTLNRTEGIRPETLRAGRLDKMWCTMLPNARERWEIFDVHCRLRGLSTVSYTKKERQEFEQVTNGYVGAEIEQIVKDAKVEFFEPGTGRVLSNVPMSVVLAEARAITPVSRLDGDNIKAIEQFCSERAFPVGLPVEGEIREKLGRGVAIEDDWVN